MYQDYSHFPITPLKTYEKNYQKVLNLFPSLVSIKPRTLNLPYSIENDTSGLTIELQEHYRYTSVVKLFKEMPINPKIAPFEMMLRLSHDVKLVEVISFQGSRHIIKYHHYPNNEMYQIDEKKQLNHHLSKVLDMALATYDNRIGLYSY